jgi:putative transcriptional regulator
LTVADKGFDLGQALKEGLTGALAWKRGELALEVVNVDPMPAERIR